MAVLSESVGQGLESRERAFQLFGNAVVEPATAALTRTRLHIVVGEDVLATLATVEERRAGCAWPHDLIEEPVVEAQLGFRRATLREKAFHQAAPMTALGPSL